MYERSLHVFDVLSMSLVSHQSDMLLLTTSTAVTGGGVSPTFVCVSVCFAARYFKNRCSQDHQTRQAISPRNTFILEGYK